MKLDVEIKDNFVGCYDEARGIAVHKEDILNKNKSRCPSYVEGKLLNFALMFLISVILSMGVYYCWLLYPIVIMLIIISVVYLGSSLVEIYRAHKRKKKMGFKSSILVDKEGLTDESYYGIKMVFNHSLIKGIVVGKYTVTVLTDTPCYFYFPISKKAEVVKAFKKYNKNVKVIE